MLFILLCIASIFIDHHVSGLKAKILGGIKVKPNELQYMVAITQNGRFICGGSIIDERFILTAAHCLIDETNNFRHGYFQIIAGCTDLIADQPSRIVINVKAMYAPMIYNGTIWQTRFPEGDIAVVELTDRLPLFHNGNLKTLKLPGFAEESEPYIYQISVVSGYGLDKVETANEDGRIIISNASSSLRMYKANSVVFDHVECSNHYETMYDSNLCGKVVNYEDDTPQGVCEGDSGGPLVWNGDVVIGVVSGSAPACNENEYPSVYTRVATYLSFIRDITSGRQLYKRVKVGVFGWF